jgi:uncharacterized membrane protein (UPF0127 family)
MVAPIARRPAVRIAAVLLAVATLVAGCGDGRTPATLAGLPVVTVEVGAGTLRLAVAADHRVGLAGIDDLGDLGDLGDLDGMLFDFGREVEPSAHPFWMAGVRFPLELAFVAADGTVVDRVVLPACPDRTACPRHLAAARFRWVVEVPPGMLGDAVRIPLPVAPTSFVPSPVR